MAASSALRIVLSSSWPVMRIVRPEAGWTSTAAPRAGSGTLGLAWIHLYTVHPLIRVQHRVPGHGGGVDGKCCTYHQAGDAVPQYHCLCGPVGSIVLAVQEIFHRPCGCWEVVKSLLQSLRIHEILPEASGTFRS